MADLLSMLGEVMVQLVFRVREHSFELMVLCARFEASDDDAASLGFGRKAG